MPHVHDRADMPHGHALAEGINMRLAKELRSFIDTANAPIFGIDAEVRLYLYLLSPLWSRGPHVLCSLLLLRLMGGRAL